MGMEQFPEIETFQKLPHKVIVKGGSSGFDAAGRPELRGIIINNLGYPIKEAKVFVVIFDGRDIPILNKSVIPEPSVLAQGMIGSFTFVFEDYDREVKNYYLYANWKYDDSE